ncbi:MAG: hypothetical protein J6W36_00505 [Clostridiales bacterium]|nr:hypothetical protein [Clostridiales bacterium]
MKKSVYFIIQIIWSLIVSTVIWYLGLKNTSFDFYHNSDNSFAGMIMFWGAIIYLILTLVQIGVGVKVVKNWRWWMILVSLFIAGAVAFLGIYVVAYGTEFLNKTFNAGLFFRF